MDYHITVDHRSAPQIPALLKQKLKSPLANWSRINVDSLLPQGRKFSWWQMPFAEAGGGNGSATSPVASPCAELLFPLFRLGPTFSTVMKKPELGWTCSTPGTGRGGAWVAAFNSINYDNTWYYQSHCSNGREWGTVESFTIYVLQMTVRIYQTNISPKNLKERKNHPQNPTPKFIVKNISFWEWTSVATEMTWICFQSWNCFPSFHLRLASCWLKNTEMFLDHHMPLLGYIALCPLVRKGKIISEASLLVSASA